MSRLLWLRQKQEPEQPARLQRKADKARLNNDWLNAGVDDSATPAIGYITSSLLLSCLQQLP